MLPIADRHAKLGWAKRHLNALDVKLFLFKQGEEGDPYTFDRYDDLENQRYVIKVKQNPVPDYIALIAGDAIGCMRASLDHLVWSLAVGPGKLPVADHTQFPILDFWNRKTRRRFDRQTSGVPHSAIEEIKLLQPYQRGTSPKTHPLWRLNALCNLDKHRRLPANGTELDIFGFPEHLRPHMKLEGTADLDFVVSVPLAFKAQMEFKPRIAFEVHFGSGDPERDPDAISETIKGLWEIHNFIRDAILPRFIRFFPSS